MRLLVQRVAQADVRRADGRRDGGPHPPTETNPSDPTSAVGDVVGRIGRGLLVLVGVAPGDGDAEVAWAAAKLLGMRVFADREGKMNLDLAAVGGDVLVVSQFTLYGDLRGGRRPGFSAAAAPDDAERVYLALVERLRSHGATVATGAFGRAMHVASINDGPVTLWLDSAER